jgi:hypothetical protein
MNGGDPPARFEIGVFLGEPLALSAKYWLNNRIAIGAGADGLSLRMVSLTSLAISFCTPTIFHWMSVIFQPISVPV